METDCGRGRAGLEHYIQSLARLNPTPPQLAIFLQLPDIGTPSHQLSVHGLLYFKNSVENQVLRIRDILARIRIRGSVPLTNGSGYFHR